MFQIAEDFTAKPVDGEYWVPLVQKAFAKFFGSYYKMNGGVTPTALYNLTGGLILNIENYTGRPYLLIYFIHHSNGNFNLCFFFIFNLFFYI